LPFPSLPSFISSVVSALFTSSALALLVFFSPYLFIPLFLFSYSFQHFLLSAFLATLLPVRELSRSVTSPDWIGLGQGLSTV
jgi:hypothetical protein